MKTPSTARALAADVPAGPRPPFPRLWLASLFLVTLGMWIGLLGPVQILLPTQIASLDAADKVLALGLVTGLAAVAAVVSAPLTGLLSDRTAWRFGRRRSWVAICAALCASALFLLPWQSSVVAVGACWIVVHAGVNGMHAALCAGLADRVPASRRGLASAVVGLAQPLGLVIGTLLASGLPTRTGYLVMSGLVAGCTVPYLLAGEGPAPPGPRRPEHGPQSGARPGLRRSPDLAWAWGGRFAAQLATTMATVYLLYFLRDRIRLDDPARGVAVLSLLFTLGVIVASMAAGPLSDRAGRRKVFVSAASLLMATGLIIMAVVPVWTAALLAATALGAGYGVYFAIDQALVIEILPGESDRGRQLGVMNAAGSGAVALAPLIAAPIIPAGGYSTLYVLAACLAIAAAVFVRPIKSVA